MKIVNSEFIVSAVKQYQYPKDDLPQIVLVGKSNVGKFKLFLLENLMLVSLHLLILWLIEKSLPVQALFPARQG